MSQHSKKTQGKDSKSNTRKNKSEDTNTDQVKKNISESTELQKSRDINPKEELTDNFSNIIIIDDSHRKYNKRAIASNWSKYDEPIDSREDVDPDDKATDFKTLLAMPASRGGHFQFKNERIEEFKTDRSAYFDCFASKPAIIAAGIASVPFYLRNDLDKSLFTSTDIQIMNDKAKLGLQKFNALVRSEKDTPIKLNPEKDSHEKLNTNKSPKDTEKGSEVVFANEDITEIKDVPTPATETAANTDTPNKVLDFDKWLDDFLDN